MRIEPPSLEERICGARVWLAALILVMAVLTGCSTRYLTAEQDAGLREMCEARGCKVVPTDLWQQIEQLLHMLVPQPRQGTS